MGFTDAFNANYFCRFCSMHRNETKYAVKETISLLRNESKYEDDLQKSVSETGIISECVFNELKNFHATKNYVVDIMHDIQEGVLNYEMAMMLFEFISTNNYFSLEILNERVRSFNYGDYDKINKPTQILDCHLKLKKLRFSSSETLTFAKYLPLIIGDLVPESDEKWKLFIILRKITDLALSDTIDATSIKDKENLVSDHHAKFIRIYNVSLHKQIGPLKQMSSVRFESKHKILKDIAKSTTSRRDICKTIFNRLRFGSVHSSERVMDIKNDIRVSFGKLLENNHYSWININNRKLKINSILNIGSDGVNPIFFKVKTIKYDCPNNLIKLVLIELKTIYFDNHLYSFCVEETNSLMEHKINLNEYFAKISMIKLNKKNYIVLS